MPLLPVCVPFRTSTAVASALETQPCISVDSHGARTCSDVRTLSGAPPCGPSLPLTPFTHGACLPQVPLVSEMFSQIPLSKPEPGCPEQLSTPAETAHCPSEWPLLRCGHTLQVALHSALRPARAPCCFPLLRGEDASPSPSSANLSLPIPALISLCRGSEDPSQLLGLSFSAPHCMCLYHWDRSLFTPLVRVGFSCGND